MKKVSFPVRITALATSASLIFFASFASYAANIVANVPTPPQIDARAWILMDYHSGKILAESNADERLDPASLTKMMASYVIGQAIKSGRITPQDMVTIGKDAWATGNPILQGSSLMFLKPGDTVSVSDLNKGIVIQSGNDASIALADYIAGSQDAFVGLMNRYVQQLGLKNTHFTTVHGLDSKGQYSTARDMALIGQALIRDVPAEYALNKEKSFTFDNIRQMNRNRLLWSSNLHVDGIKTGYTSGAGYNLVASATNGNQRLISVVLGAKTDAIRFRESEQLLNWGFHFFETVTPIKAGQAFNVQRVWYGDHRNVNLGVAQDAAITIPRGQLKNLKASLVFNQPQLLAPLKKNQVVGTIDFKLNGKTIETRPLVVMDTVKEGGFFSRIWDFIMLKVSTLFGK
ncbi:D-alanyl-D-alanine carboxypeptidase (penicillin-binding protein 5/6) [Izhakiella capsodis]|uniref:serine-type D-Ala-D-Ala carboxypeptidase n=1 Tax=Izhakiella capsodis TaxID=1367852 RepID=A0A1I4UJP0_9GAMM|nr:serine hydrolase [Izhakiella capsodis]SFM89105.1 D-alanyl-D-alanine carboxypeptidase (penicillin-binding protein 5/6) [Izhakiella capsodis]